MKSKNKSFIFYIVLIIALLIIFIALMIWEWTCKLLDREYPFFTTEIAKMAIALLQTVFITFCITGELRKNSKLTKQALDLESQGITGVNKEGVLRENEIKELFTQSSLIKIMVVCGLNFLTKNKEWIKTALKNKCEIRLLIANETSEFVSEITQQLDSLESKEEGKNNDQAGEIKDVLKLVEELKSYGHIEVRQYNTEYRVPFYLGYINREDTTIVKGWYNSIIPVCSPRKVLLFKGELEETERQNYVKVLSSVQSYGECIEDHNYTVQRLEDKRNFIVDLECHFDYLWRKYQSTNKLSQNQLLKYALEEAKKISPNVEFLVQDLFKFYEWKNIPENDCMILGKEFFNEVQKKNSQIKPIKKTEDHQQVYIKLN